MIQNLVTKKILGVFKTAPIIPRELELAIPLVIVRLNHNNRRYVLRVLKLSLSHPIRIEFEKASNLIRERETDIYLDSNSTYSTTKLKSNIQIENLVESIYNLVDL